MTIGWNKWDAVTARATQVPASQCLCPKLLKALDYWRNLPMTTQAGRPAGALPEAARHVPLRATFDPLHLWTMMPNAMFMEPLPTGDFRCRVMGTTLCEITGQELTNKQLSALEPAQVRQILLDQLSEAMDGRAPVTVRQVLSGLLSWGGGGEGAEYRELVVWRLTLPFSTQAGGPADRFLTIDSPADPSKAVAGWYKAARAAELDDKTLPGLEQSA